VTAAAIVVGVLLVLVACWPRRVPLTMSRVWLDAHTADEEIDYDQ